MTSAERQLYDARVDYELWEYAAEVLDLIVALIKL
jgi:hypothetical protein